MIKKFGKNRSVDSNWLNVPIKYMLEIKSSDTKSKSGKEIPDETWEESYNNYVTFCNDLDLEPEPFNEYKTNCIKNYEENGIQPLKMKSIPPKHDKTFCILELSKHIATCAWRNNQTCKCGMTFTCKVEKHNDGTIGIIYKDKFYPINKSSSGWVF